MKDHEMLNVTYQLKHCVRLLLIATKCSFYVAEVTVKMSIFMGLTLN